MAARASRMENQDAIDTAIVSMLADPKEVNAATVRFLFSSFLSNLKKCTLLHRTFLMHF